MRRRSVLVTVAVAVLPFVTAAVFTWLATGRPVGLVVLLGGGDLLPATAALAARSVTVFARAERSGVRLALNWALVVLASAAFSLPYTGAAAYEPRLAYLSLAFFGCAVVVSAGDPELDKEEPAHG